IVAKIVQIVAQGLQGVVEAPLKPDGLLEPGRGPANAQTEQGGHGQAPGAGQQFRWRVREQISKSLPEPVRLLWPDVRRVQQSEQQAKAGFVQQQGGPIARQRVEQGSRAQRQLRVAARLRSCGMERRVECLSAQQSEQARVQPVRLQMQAELLAADALLNALHQRQQPGGLRLSRSQAVHQIADIVCEALLFALLGHFRGRFHPPLMSPKLTTRRPPKSLKKAPSACAEKEAGAAPPALQTGHRLSLGEAVDLAAAVAEERRTRRRTKNRPRSRCSKADDCSWPSSAASWSLCCPSSAAGSWITATAAYAASSSAAAAAIVDNFKNSIARAQQIKAAHYLHARAVGIHRSAILNVGAFDAQSDAENFHRPSVEAGVAEMQRPTVGVAAGVLPPAQLRQLPKSPRSLLLASAGVLKTAAQARAMMQEADIVDFTDIIQQKFLSNSGGSSMNRSLSASSESLLDELATKSRVLFANLDRDGKGFIDAGELADFCTDMSEEECQRLFRELDRDGDGRISVADFREGFRLISRTVHQRCEHHEQRRRSSNASTNGLSPKPYSPNSSKANSIDEVEEGGSASAAGGGRRSGISDPASLGECLQSLSCQDQVFEFYHQLGEERPTLLDNFETVLAELMAVVKALQTEQQRLEQLLSSERQRHAQAIRDLEVEVEHQLKSAEQAVLSRERQGLEQGVRDMLAQRDVEISSLKQQLAALKQRAAEGREVDTETAAYKAELEKIRSEKKALQLDLSGAETRLAIVMSEVATLKQALQDRDQQLRRERESMQEQVREQDRITQQLHLLHQTNRQLRDKNEELREALEASQASAVRLRQQQQPASSRLLQQSHLAESALRICDPNYPNSGRRMDSCDLDSDNPDSGMSTLRDVPDLEVEDAANNWAAAAAAAAGISAPPPRSPAEQQQRALAAGRATARHSRQLQQQPLNSESEAGEDAAEEELYRLREYDIIQPEQQQQQQPHQVSSLRRSVSRQVAQNFDEDADEQPALMSRHSGSRAHLGVSTDSLQRSQECLSGHSAITNVPRRDRRGGGGAGSRRQKPESSPGRQAAAGQEASTSCAIVTVSGNPERMFKVVLAGDAAVGKSSFIMRLCDNRFTEKHHGHSRGVHIPNLFQLWDTAGQERFRSVAKSYFRRADGVLLLFDCTYERSFLSVREWVDQVHEAADKSVPIMICSNKTDLRLAAQQQGKRVVEYTEARKLAQEYDALFAEVSAKSGENVQMCVTELARLMQASEDLQVNRANVRLGKDDDKGKNAKEKSACCDF
uniref:EF-hand domain-containing protein n=1 Tax=Macrostomum lignano TaxID=282301 RepID=A0A1I8IRU3_9PLAT